MKIKDLLGFNPEAELKVFDSKGKEIELTDICWSANDNGKASISQKKTTKEVFIQVKTEEKTEWWENIKNEIKTPTTNPWTSVKPATSIVADGPSPYVITFSGDDTYTGKLTCNSTSYLTIDTGVFTPKMYQEEGIHLDSVYKIIKMPSSNCMKKNIGAQEGHFIRLHYALTNVADYKRTRAQYMEITNITTNKTHKISMNILANALKHYTLERVR